MALRVLPVLQNAAHFDTSCIDIRERAAGAESLVTALQRSGAPTIAAAAAAARARSTLVTFACACVRQLATGSLTGAAML